MILLSGLSLIHNISYWYAKILDFPRLQYLFISVVCLVSFLLLKKEWNIASRVLVLGLLLSIIVHSVKIGPYWLGEKVVPSVEKEETGGSSVKIIIANVLVTNRRVEPFLDLIEKYDPDVILAMEVDQWWVKQLSVLEKKFSYNMKYPLNNAYGMVLYSKLPLRNKRIRFLKHSDVPSFHAAMALPSGREFRFHGVHPVAPFPSGKYPDNVGEEEVALAKVGRLVAEESAPSIVAGDFNDVSWSRTTRFFEEQGDLRNVRLGRGLYNTYKVQSKFMRWPLDHFFVTKDFKIKELKRLESFGSDHFPMLAEFVLLPGDQSTGEK